MSDPSRQTKSDDSMLSIAADFARVLWSPTAVFRRHRATRARRVLFVLWVILTVLAIPMFLVLLAGIAEREREPGILVATVFVAPFAAVMFVLLIAFIDGAAVWLGSAALGGRLPISRAVAVATFSSTVMLVTAVPLAVAFFGSGQEIALVDNTQPPDLPRWMDALRLNLSPLAPESRPVLMVLLSFIGIPAFWLAVLHAIGTREIGTLDRPISSTAPVFWAASAAITLVFIVGIVDPLSRSLEEAGRAAERAASEAADTTRAPARAP